jgi:hypothetical protein
VNRIVTHGYPHSGWRLQVEWPGLTTFEWTYSEMCGPRQPSWVYVREFGDWIGRTQLVLQAGKPRVDIGIYRHKYLSVDIKHYNETENLFGRPSLANAGYSYNAVSPSLLSFDNAVVTDGLLAVDGPGYSAFLVNSTNITVTAVARFLEWAEVGFPILFVGTVPTETPYYNDTGDAYAASAVEKLLTYGSVKFVETEEEVVNVLKALGVRPAAENLSPVPLLYIHRMDKENEVDFFWVRRNMRFFMHKQITAGENFVIGKSVAGASSPRRMAKSSDNRAFSFDSSTGSNGTATRALGPWDLSIQEWLPNPDPWNNYTSVFVYHNYTLTDLIPWYNISSALLNTSGIGTYTTTFAWPPANSSSTDVMEHG